MDMEEQKTKALNKAVKLLGHRSRSTAELTARLQKANFDPAVVDETIDHLTNLGYLDDRKFAESWLLNRVNISYFGQNRIRQELRAKGVDNETIEAVLIDLYPEESDFNRALELAQKQLVHYRGLDVLSRRRRLAGYLTRRGYPTPIVKKVCQKILV